jgi:thioredoxin 1
MSFLERLFGRTASPGKPRATSDQTFQSDVLESALPVALYFWSPSCKHCHVMGGLLNELGPEYLGRVVILKIRPDENPKVTREYRVSSLPTVLFFKKGKVVDQIAGLQPLDFLKERLDNLRTLE